MQLAMPCDQAFALLNLCAGGLLVLVGMGLYLLVRDRER